MKCNEIFSQSHGNIRESVLDDFHHTLVYIWESDQGLKFDYTKIINGLAWMKNYKYMIIDNGKIQNKTFYTPTPP